MSKKYSNKRVLLTDYYEKNPQLYEDIILLLTQDGASILALLNETTLASRFITKFPRVTPILLNTCRNYQELNEEEEIDVNKINFCSGFQKTLLDSLPNVDYILNFAGPSFVEAFLDRSGRTQYKLVNVEFGHVRSKLKSSTLFPEECSQIIVHVVPDIPAAGKLLNSFGLGGAGANSKSIVTAQHYVKGVPEYMPNAKGPDFVAVLDINDSNPYVSQPIIFLRSMSLRMHNFLQSSILRQNPQDFNERRDHLLRKEIGKLNKNLKAIYNYSIIKYRKKKLDTQALDRNAEARVSHQSQNSSSNGNRMEETRQKIADHKKKMEARKTARERQSDASKLHDEWYNDTLFAEAAEIRKITKKYAEKIRAAQIVLA